MDKRLKKSKVINLGILMLVILLIGIYIYRNNPSNESTFYLRCPSNLIFGINCPGCGTQRALYHLLHLEFVEAFRYNALFVLAIPFFIYWSSIQLYNKIFQAKKTTQIPTNKYLWIGLFVIVLLFGIIRNIPLYPFTFFSP